MSQYLIGDLQGCDNAFGRLLAKIDFSPSRDTLFVLGDLVNRGPSSLATLERLIAMGDAARCLLGNHDLNLLAVANGVREPNRKDTLTEILGSTKRAALLHWLRQQSLAIHYQHQNNAILMVHAGVFASWTAIKTIALSGEIETILRGANEVELREFLAGMYGDTPKQWTDELQGLPRQRAIVNALTRTRFCAEDGSMDFKSKDEPAAAPEGLMPWFDVPNRQTKDVIVAFGHWSTLGWLDRQDVYALDGGCVWGGSLNALQLAGDGSAAHRRISVKCKQAQKPQLIR